jgi:acetate kinase
VGENSRQVRADVAGALSFAGLRLADGAAPPGTGDRRISAADSRVAGLVVHAREDLVILAEVVRRAGGAWRRA